MQRNFMLMAFEKRNHIKVFVSSTVYDFEPQLDVVYSLLDGYGYDVLMSHKGTVPLDSKLSNVENCLKGVEECDVFLGFIRPLIGTGVLDRSQPSITEQEFEVAYRVNMPRFVLADYRVVFARQFLSMMKIPVAEVPYVVTKGDNERPNRVVHAACIDMYNAAIKNNEFPLTSRKGNWVQEYKNQQDILMHLEAQFKDPDRIRQLMQKNG